MAKKIMVDGNTAAAQIAFACSEVAAIYPITPSSPMAETCDELASMCKTNIWGSIPSIVEMESEGGAAGAEASFTKTFTAAQAGYAPKLKVSHADYSIQEFQCPAVKTTDGPEYTFKVSQDKLDIPAGTHSVTTRGDASVTQCYFSCNAEGNISVKLSTGESMTGSYYAGGPVSADACKGTFELTLSAAATCTIQWN